MDDLAKMKAGLWLHARKPQIREAFDAKGSIGGGTHERFIIKNEKFLAKAQSKKEN